jgi:uncharacterized membrane protein
MMKAEQTSATQKIFANANKIFNFLNKIFNFLNIFIKFRLQIKRYKMMNIYHSSPNMAMPIITISIAPYCR